MLSDLIIQEFIRTGRLPDTVACLGNCDLDCPRADRQGSDNLVASDRDDLVGADVGQWRRCFNIELSDHRVGTRSSLQGKGDIVNLLGCEEVTDFLICCRWRTGLVVAEELPRGFVSEVQLAGHDCMVCERGAFPQALLIELGAGALEADFPGGSRVAAERHRLAIHHAVLLTPATMGFANVDLQIRIAGSPLADLLADDAKSLHVLRRTSMLGDVHTEAVADQNAGQVGMTIQEESVSERTVLRRLGTTVLQAR